MKGHNGEKVIMFGSAMLVRQLMSASLLSNAVLQLVLSEIHAGNDDEPLNISHDI